MSDEQPLELSLAPDVDPAWTGSFVAALRKADVPGRTIAHALITVNDEVRASGRTAVETFGNAVDYAATLSAQNPTQTNTATPTIVPAIVGFLGMMLCLWAVRPLRDGTPIALALGVVISAAIVVAIMVALALRMNQFLHLISRGTVLPMLTGFLTMGLILVPLNLFKQTLALVLAWPVAAIGIALLATSTVVYLRQYLGTRVTLVPLILAIAYPTVTLILAVVTWVFVS